MRLKSNGLSSQVLDPIWTQESNTRSILKSLLIHAMIVIVVFGFFQAQRKIEKIQFTVIEKPAEVPRAVPALAPKLEAPVPPPPRAQLKSKKDLPRKKAVFGVSNRSLKSDVSGSAPAVKTGNTLAQAPDQEKWKPEDGESLPEPADEIEVTRMPQLISEVRIAYPSEAKKNGIQGSVVMDLLIDSTGVVRDVRLIEGPGYGLNEAATQALRQFRFSPAKIEDRSVAVRIRYSYRFVLER